VRSISEVLAQAESYLRQKQIDSPRLSAQLLLAYVLGCTRTYLYTHPDRVLSLNEHEHFLDLIGRRANGEPVAYILGQKEFYSLDFKVNPHVLIPRPETETIIDLVRGIFPREKKFIFADLGTGSGCLAITIAHLCPLSCGLAMDICTQALRVAVFNARRHQVENRLTFICSDLGTALKSYSLDLIVSNPPYISEQEFSTLSFEIANFEPREALLAGPTGLEFYVELEKQARQSLKFTGILIAEMGYKQSTEIRKIFSSWSDVQIIKDLAGHDRILMARP
jgi:release factor glutamine methyltransferase